MAGKISDFTKEETDAIFQKISVMVDAAKFRENMDETKKWLELADKVSLDFKDGRERSVAMMCLGYKMAFQKHLLSMQGMMQKTNGLINKLFGGI